MKGYRSHLNSAPNQRCLSSAITLLADDSSCRTTHQQRQRRQSKEHTDCTSLTLARNALAIRQIALRAVNPLFSWPSSNYAVNPCINPSFSSLFLSASLHLDCLPSCSMQCDTDAPYRYAYSVFRKLDLTVRTRI